MGNQELLNKVERIQAVTIQPGDTIVISMDDFVRLPSDQRKELTERFKDFFPGAKILIMSHSELNLFRSCELPALKGQA